MKLGKLVSEFRSNNGLTMEEFAKRAHLSKGYISMIEKDCNPRTKKEIVPTFSTLKLIAEAMEIDVSSLILALDDEHPISWNHSENDGDSEVSNMLIKIKALKKEKGFTNETLSQISGVPKSTLDKILAGIIKDPSIISIIKIAKALNVSLDFLINDACNVKLADALELMPEWKERFKRFEYDPDYRESFSKIMEIHYQLSNAGKEKVLDYATFICSSEKKQDTDE